MFRVFVSLAMAVLWTVVANAQPANSRLDDIIKRGTLRVGMTGDYRPFTYFDKTMSKFTGFDVDMAEALGKALGVKVEFVQTAWPQLMKDFEADNFDVDLMMTDSSETRYQQKQHPGVLCAVHPEKPFDFAEKAYWLQRDVALKAFVDQWLHIATEDGSFKKIYAAWFD